MLGYLAAALAFEWAKKNLFDTPPANVPGAPQGQAPQQAAPPPPPLDPNLDPQTTQEIYQMLERGNPQELEQASLTLIKMSAPVASQLCAVTAEQIAAHQLFNAQVEAEHARQRAIFEQQRGSGLPAPVPATPPASVAGVAPAFQPAFQPPAPPPNAAANAAGASSWWEWDESAQKEAERQAEAQRKIAQKGLDEWKRKQALHKEKERIELSLQAIEAGKLRAGETIPAAPPSSNGVANGSSVHLDNPELDDTETGVQP